MPDTKAMMAIVQKARVHKYKYIDPTAVNDLVGRWAPLSAWHFSYLVECFIQSMNQHGTSIMNASGCFKTDIARVPGALIGVGDKLLQSNRNYRPGSWELFNDLDFDITHTCVDGLPVETMVKPYFAYDEYRRPSEEVRVVVHATVAKFGGTKWTISFPLQFVMKGYPKNKKQHFGYCHTVALLNDDGHVDKQYYYAGVTKRNWLQRMSEHFNEIKSGSNKLFHQTWRNFQGEKNVLLGSELIVGDHTFEQIMSWEEATVDRYMETGMSLNMIPGGFKGMQFLHEHRLINSNRVSLKVRDRAAIEYQRSNPRLGIPNLHISELWKDDEYAAKIICGAKGRLSVKQVRDIRRLDREGISVAEIAKAIGAIDNKQVQRVISGETYSRIT